MKVSRKLSIGASIAGAMLVGSIAFAAWTATGSGSGYAKATNAQALTTVDVSAAGGGETAGSVSCAPSGCCCSDWLPRVT